MRTAVSGVLEELVIPCLLLAVGALLVLTTVAGGQTAAREGGLAVVVLAAGAYAGVDALRLLRRGQ